MTTAIEVRRPYIPSANEYRAYGRKVELTCCECETVGSYNVGRVVIDPAYTEGIGTGQRKDLNDFVAFSNIFRCRSCGQGSKWKMSLETKGELMLAIARASMLDEETPVAVAHFTAFDGTPIRTGADAENYVKKLVAAAPESAFLRSRLGNIYKNSGMDAQAKEQFLKAIELDPTRMDVLHSLGGIAKEEGRLDDARRYFEDSIRYSRLTADCPDDVIENIFGASLQELAAMNTEQVPQDQFPTAVRIRSSREIESEADQSPAALVAAYRLNLATDEGWQTLVDLCLGKPPRTTSSTSIIEQFRDDIEVVDIGALADEASEHLLRNAVAPRRHYERPEQLYAERVGRNDPCPCGSGKKFKKCCG